MRAGAARHSAAQHGAARHSTCMALHSIPRNCTAPHGMAQHKASAHLASHPTRTHTLLPHPHTPHPTPLHRSPGRPQQRFAHMPPSNTPPPPPPPPCSWLDLSPDAKHLLMGMLAYDPARRLTMPQASWQLVQTWLVPTGCSGARVASAAPACSPRWPRSTAAAAFGTACWRARPADMLPSVVFAHYFSTTAVEQYK